MEILFPLLIFLFMVVVCGLVIGRTVEKNHFARIEEKEAIYKDVLVTQLKSFPGSSSEDLAPGMVMSEVVIGSDYLKTWLSGWRAFFGGEMKSLRTLQERAKREALLRLIEDARDKGFNAVCNVRINAADIGGNTSGKKSKMPLASVMATGTGYRISE